MIYVAVLPMTPWLGTPVTTIAPRFPYLSLIPTTFNNIPSSRLWPSPYTNATTSFASSQPIDRGWKAWCVVLGSILLQTFAFAPTEFIFGVFEQEYLTQYPMATPSTIALVGTTGTSMTYLVGMVSGAVSSRWGYRVTSGLGTVIMALSLLLASFSTQIWHLFLTQGIMFGTGASLVYFSAIAAPGHWFIKKRGLALGIGASGAGFGGFYLAPLSQYMVDHIGLQWTLRVLALYCLVVCGVGSVLLFPRSKVESLLTPMDREKTMLPQASSPSALASMEPVMDTVGKTERRKGFMPMWWQRIPKHYRETAFIMLAAFEIMLSMAYLTPMYFMELYSTYISIPRQSGAVINGWYNAASFVSRIGSGILADTISSNWVLLVCTWGMALAVCLIWAMSRTYAVFLLFAVLYGLFFSGVSTVTPVLIMEHYACILGAVYTMSSPALILGSVLSGELLNMTKPNISYIPLIEFVGALFAAASIFASAWVYCIQKRKRETRDQGPESAEF
ncbi:hypothetical protein EDD11_001754 [Mortierella claussenii]|nr:hypothetical protein EDD11_001754 [Mortierella claussenii]